MDVELDDIDALGVGCAGCKDMERGAQLAEEVPLPRARPPPVARVS